MHVVEATTIVPAPGALRLTDTGRRDPDPAIWRHPLPPALAVRVDAKRLEEHERLVGKFDDARRRVVALTAEREQVKVADEQALQHAITHGTKVPRAKLPAVEEELAETVRQGEALGRMVLGSGTALVQSLSEDDLKAAVVSALDESRAVLERIPDQARSIFEDLDAIGAARAQVAWIERLRHVRRQYPFRPRRVPGSPNLAEAREAAERLRGHVDEELHVLRQREGPPPKHHVPRGVPEALEKTQFAPRDRDTDAA
jgi:hypothetical protein